jgi:hypothetical protein
MNRPNRAVRPTGLTALNLSRPPRAERHQVPVPGAWLGQVKEGASMVRVYEEYIEGASEVDGRWMGLAMPVVCLSVRGA